jgi:hypothetical protein
MFTNKALTVLIAATLALGSAVAHAADGAVDKAIVIRDSATNALGFTFKTSKAAYKAQEAIRFTAKADKDFYLYVYNANANGTATLIYPNKKEGGAMLKKGAPHALPKKVEFAADGTATTERLIVIATTQKMDIAAAQLKSTGDFYTADEATLVEGMEQKGIVIRDRPIVPATPAPAGVGTVVRTLSLNITK